jgi:hypothetical protein
MRRYCRYKICKSNFHFFFFSSRLLNFNRPKWNALKEKIEKFKKLKNLKKTNSYKIKFPRFILGSLYNIPFLFKSLKNFKKHSLGNIHAYRAVMYKSTYFNCSSYTDYTFDYAFYN